MWKEVAELGQLKHFEIFHRCITTNHFINKIWTKFDKLLDTRPIPIYKFHSSGLDCLNETFFIILFIIYVVNRLFIHVFKRSNTQAIWMKYKLFKICNNFHKL